jgi:hypothetical protein
MSTTPVQPAVVTTIDVDGGQRLGVPSKVNRKLAEEIEPHWYQTNVSLSQPPTTGADRPVRGFVTNVSWRA